MKTQPLYRYALNYACYIVIFLWTTLSVNAQCPTIPDQTPPAICDASGFTFNDLDAYAIDGGNGIAWYDNATGGSPYSGTQIVMEGTYYVDDDSGACGTRVSITVDFQVDDSGQNLDGIYCSNDNPTVQTYIDDVLQPNVPVGGSVEVYNDFDLTSQANGTDPLPNGATNYFIVFIDNGGCESQLEVGSTAIFAAPSDPTPSTSQAFCSDTNPTVADLDPGTVDSHSWYESLDAFGDPIQPALSTSTALIDGNTYYVQIDGVFCDSHPVAVTVTIDTPIDPGTPGSLQYCVDDVASVADFDLFDELGGTPATSGVWSGPLTTSNGHLGTVNITTLTTPGAYTFTYTVPSNGACPQGSATVVITIEDVPESGNPLAPAQICEENIAANSPFDLFTLLDGTQDTNGTWYVGTDTSGATIANPIDLTGFTDGTYNYTYSVPDIGTCSDVDVTVQIIILPQPDTGVASLPTYCENDLAANSPLDLFGELTGEDAGGTWSDDHTTGALSGSDVDLTALAIGSYNFTYSITAANGCTNSTTVTVTVEDAPESGNALAPAQICEENIAANSPFDLFTLLDGTQDTNGTWYVGTDTTGATTTSSIDLTGFTDGTYDYTYSVPDIGTCSDVDVTVQIIILPQPDTGVASSPTYCENDLVANSPLDLFGELTGEDAGGTWSDDDTTGALSGSDVDLTALAIGSYNFTYSITAANGCTNSTTVTVTVEDAPESGNALAPAHICEENIAANSPFDLFTLLDGTQDTNGTWYVGIDTSGATTTSSIDLTGFTDGTYDYTYSVPDIGTCSDVDVTVQIIIMPQPNTGVAASPTYCENDLAANSPLDLFGELTGEDAGGTWSDDDATGALTGSDVDLTALTIGSYNFTYSITDGNGCTNSTTVTVTVEDAPESGTANTPVEFCVADVTTGQTYDLFDLLAGEDQAGTWLDDDATGALSGNLVTLDGLTAGTYDFTYDVDAIGTCDDVLVTVSIIINDTPAPTAAASQEFCDSAIVSDLVATGTTIQWYDEATGGTALAGTDALVDGETYYATQTDATTGCESSVRTLVTVTIHQSPNSGNPSATPIVDCDSNNSVDLFTGLDGSQDAGGVWQDTDGTGALTGNIFDATAVTPGTYQFTYYVMASAPCVDSSTIITVTIDGPLNAGTDNTLDICSNNGTTDLFTLLGGADAGGTWSPAMASGTGVFDPLVDVDGTYTYTLTNGCGTETSEVVVTVTQAPIAGTDTAVTICVIDGVTDLFPLLGGAHTGGTWSPALASGTGEFDPTVDTAGIYTYTVAATAPCLTDATAEVTVTIDDTPPPVAINPNPEFCQVDNPTVADLDGNISSTGTLIWYADAAQTTVLSPTDPLIDGEDYYGTQTNASGCESSSNTQVNVTINDVATPTLIDSGLELCINDNPTINDLTLNISEYSAALDNVIWYDTATGGSPISDTTMLANQSTYYAVLYDAATGCESSVRLEFTTDLTTCGELILPDGFSPNGDGVNDTYDYNNLDVLYPNFEMEIYNRYGTLIYKGNASSPRFDGKSNQSGSIGNGNLPVGVYFYIFNYNDGTNKPEQGRLYLSR